MCLFAVVYQTIPDCPVLVFANREESFHRPSTSPSIVFGDGARCNWMGGRDLQAGGTWLGINEFGVIAAITNRPKNAGTGQIKSRGLLCRSMLEQGTIGAAEAEFHRQWDSENFAGFNLILLAKERGCIISAGDEFSIQPIEPGQHAIGNGDWNDPRDRRIARVSAVIDELLEQNTSQTDWVSQGKTICGLGASATGDAICIPSSGGWGTVSSTVIALGNHRDESRYEHANGPPSSTAYRDDSELLRTLLKDNAA